MVHFSNPMDRSSSAPAPLERDTWYYPPEMADDLKDVDMDDHVKAEILNSSWEFMRCAIPYYTNWNRYLACARLSTITTAVEFLGGNLDVKSSDSFLGYSLSALLAIVFEGTPYHEDMSREFRACITSPKLV
ncbi:hypothetical protein C8J57DRAFT_1591079 [Mycena rebaudengoi]|nr:hypothetical protein C8J57DRAFT_1591079 [Mycena rebaudengoi]